MNYVEELLEQGRQEGELKGRQEGELKGRQEGELKGRQEGELKGRQEGELKGQLRTIEGFVVREVPWSTIEAATGIDEATFRRLRQRIDDCDENGTVPTA